MAVMDLDRAVDAPGWGLAEEGGLAPAERAALARSRQDWLVGRVLPPAGHLDGLLGVVHAAALSRMIPYEEIEGIIATAEGRAH
jgi:hypothetical protein